MSDGRIKFENPPVSELVIALFYLPIAELKAQHIGLYWNTLRERYPICEQQLPFITPPDASGLLQTPSTDQALFNGVGEVFPLPRFWFSSSVRPTLIQVQRNAFVFNWRREPSSEYPHYETVVEDFWREFTGYKTFIEQSVGGKIDVVQRCELTYVNLIDLNELPGGPFSLGEVLPLLASLQSIEANGRTLASLNATVTYQLNPTLLIDLIPRMRTLPESSQPVISLELRAYGVPSDLSLGSTRAWYNAAHDATYQLFLDSTTRRMQEEIWKLR